MIELFTSMWHAVVFVCTHPGECIAYVLIGLTFLAIIPK
jgi:hypothetical protein